MSKFFTVILNQRGQAAIFVALMFNVLFVFFAMAINVALVVHDKINLQNSADLAVYYAASKQAEILNAIAHQNYQIRQSWKLLTWRYRVLGTMGLYRQSPSPVQTGEVSDTVYDQAVRPSLCITYKPNWAEIPERENLCNTPNLKIPALPEVKVIAGFLGINHGIAALSRQLRMQFDDQCSRKGAYNWWFAMSIMHAFRQDQRNRKIVIRALANTLSQGRGGDFADLDGAAVSEGARKTFIKNLTYANRQAFEAGQGQFELFNSLEGVSIDQWLPEVVIAPTMLYTDVSMASGCEAQTQPISELPMREAGKEKLKKPWPAGFDAENLFPWRNASLIEDKDFRFSIGFEKNPWYMPYMGVRVGTAPRQIFFPFAGGIQMVARTFAKPFGGRIGPWYKSRWNPGDDKSSGEKTDALMAPRSEALVSGDDPTRLPNYARYPGDKLGLSSKLGINSLNGLKTLKMSFEHYKNIKEDMGPGVPNDILAWDATGGLPPEIRDYEMAAIAPDLFDVTYYSIEPNYAVNYSERINAKKDIFQIPFDVPVRSDLGMNNPVLPKWSVQQQMLIVKNKNLPKSEAYYFIKEKAHVLTAWLPGAGAFNYEVNSAMENFGKCAMPDDKLKFNNPGSCVAGGGRTGYSVKLINRDALNSNLHKIGGGAGGGIAGAILNPPPDGSGW